MDDSFLCSEDPITYIVLFLACAYILLKHKIFLRSKQNMKKNEGIQPEECELTSFVYNLLIMVRDIKNLIMKEQISELAGKKSYILPNTHMRKRRLQEFQVWQERLKLLRKYADHHQSWLVHEYIKELSRFPQKIVLAGNDGGKLKELLEHLDELGSEINCLKMLTTYNEKNAKLFFHPKHAQIDICHPGRCGPQCACTKPCNCVNSSKTSSEDQEPVELSLLAGETLKADITSAEEQNKESARFILAKEECVDISSDTTTPTTLYSATVKPLNINTGDTKTVEVVYATDPQDFYVQVTDSLELVTLMDQIAKEYSKIDSINPQLLKYGSVCIAQYAEDKMWYRAIVESVSTDKALVFFYDYGDKRRVPLEDIKEILNEHINLPAQAIPCSLLAAKPKYSSWTISEIYEFLYETEGKALEAKFVSQNNHTFDVILKDITSNTNINLQFGATFAQLEAKATIREIISDEHADLSLLPGETLKAGITFVEQNNEESLCLMLDKEECDYINSSTTTTPNSTTMTIKPMNVNIGDVKTVEVVFTTNPQDFYVQVANCTELLRLMDIISSSYETSESIKPQLLKNGIVCIARYTLDKMWYRAIVESVSTDKALVFFIDYGNKEDVPLTDIKEIFSEHINLPAQAIPCSLLAAKPQALCWSEIESQSFKFLTEGKTLEAKFVSQNNGTYDVILSSASIYYSLNFLFGATHEQL